MACELLYNGLTTGAGTQTLGEEYCDILQVFGACLSNNQLILTYAVCQVLLDLSGLGFQQ